MYLFQYMRLANNDVFFEDTFKVKVKAEIINKTKLIVYYQYYCVIKKHLMRLYTIITIV